jgi:teichuronic acid biosynthesis glycosyltransferase TuaC
MLRVLVLTSRFPDKVRPVLGNFIERGTLEFASRPGVEVRVVAPIGIDLFPHSLRYAYRRLRSVPRFEHWKGLPVYRPRYLDRPGEQSRTPARLARRLLPLFRTIRRDFPFDVIAAQYFWPEGPAAPLLARALGVPVSVKGRGHDVEAWLRHSADHPDLRDALGDAQGLLAVSATLRGEMIGLGLDALRIAVHHTGVDHDRFAPSDRTAAKAALGVDGPMLLSVGNLLARKGHDLAIEALRSLDGVTLVIAGSGPEAPALVAAADALGLGERVRLVGLVEHARMPRLYAAADVTVHASAIEGLANVWIESLASGTPVVATDVGAAREVVAHPAAGRIVDADPEAIANAVADLLARPPDRAATAAMVAGFDWRFNAEQLERHLMELALRAGDENQ